MYRRHLLVYPRPSQDDATLVYPVAQYDHDEGSAVSAGFLGIDTAGELYLPTKADGWVRKLVAAPARD